MATDRTCAIAFALFMAGCATSSKNFKPKELAPGEGVFLGKVKVYIDGNDLTRRCYIGFNEDRKPYVSLDESGQVIAKSKTGPTSLSFLICTEFGLISVNHSCEWKGANFVNAGSGKQTYFGNVRIDWAPSGSGAKKAAAALTGGLGAGLSGAVNSCGDQQITVTNEPDEIKTVYQEIDPNLNVEASLISKPGTEK